MTRPEARPEARPEVQREVRPGGTLWQEYLVAARSLDAVYREAVTGAPPEPGEPAPDDLTRLRELLRLQGDRLAAEAARAGLAAPRLRPEPAEQAAATAAAAADPAAALQRGRDLLARCDAESAGPTTDRVRHQPPRAVLLGLAVAATLACVALIMLTLAG